MNGWETVVGHAWAVELLQAEIVRGRTSHAYLFTGPDQVGKRTLARTFAQALFCEAGEPGARPCGSCRACRLVGAGRHPDLRLITPEASARGQLALKIETIRELQRDLNLAPYEAPYKIAILTRFDTATIGAANAFLKTLEEPPAHAKLFLTANEADTLLPTITSRCRSIPLRPVPVGVIYDALRQRWHVSDDRARLLAQLAGGRIGWAVTASADPAQLSERLDQLKTLQGALEGRRIERFALAEKLSGKPELLPGLLQTWLVWWRDLALLAFGESAPLQISNLDQYDQIAELAGRWSQEDILRGLRQTEQALQQLQRNANTRLVLENLFLAYPLPEPAPLAAEV